MPYYYFNVYDDDVTIDDEGFDLKDNQAAHDFAVQAVRGLAADSVLRGHFVCDHRIELFDENHCQLGKVRFGDAVKVST